jgi:UPF0271 protein
MQVDLNCDLGEGMQTDEQIIPLISSANIACGFHAGDSITMKQTIASCIQHHVSIGAHPSWPDKENFGRREMQLSAVELYNIISEQLNIISQLIHEQGGKLDHVKPHGALYNQSAKDPSIALTIAKAVKDFDASLLLYGLSGSHSISEAEKIGLFTVNEVFVDRTYQDDGSLTSRSQPNALIEDEVMAVEQAMQMITQQTVTTTSGKIIPIIADTICLHGDGIHAVHFAKAISTALKQSNIDIKKN